MAEELRDSTPDTLEHRQQVVNGIVDFCEDLMRRADKHDESKLHSPEKEKFDFVGTHQHLGKHEYGSPEYNKSLEYLGDALKHHYDNNDHHPEHFANGVDGMNLMQLCEMFFDWNAAAKRNKGGNIFESLKKNKDRFHLSDQLYNVLKNTAEAITGGKNG